MISHSPLRLALAIFGIVLIVFLPTLRNDFVNLDDPDTVYLQPMVTAGITVQGVHWAFSTAVLGHRTPLTALSHQLDCQLYGLKPWGHHLTNAILHAGAAAILFLALVQFTGAAWPAAFTALLFGLHPLRVESVAWVTERKDVLSALFFTLGLWAYGRYVRQQTVGRYLLVGLAYLGGLWSKAMVITLPCVLLLLDFWPLRRFKSEKELETDQHSPPYLILLEKLPLFCLAIVFSIIQMRDVEEMTEYFSLATRVQTALASYCALFGKLVWPAPLAVIYPHPHAWPAALWLGAALLLLLVSALAFVWRKERPYLLVGWCWYLGMLFPVSGLIQIGGQWMSDRYTYLPSIGLFIALAWTVDEVAQRWRSRRLILGSLAILLPAICAAAAIRRMDDWQDSERLFRQALTVTKHNTLARHLLADTVLAQGRTAEARDLYRANIEDDPGFPESRIAYAILREKEPGGLQEAVQQLEQAVELAPNSSSAHCNLGNAYLHSRRLPEAIAEERAAIALDPDQYEAHFALGTILAQTRAGLPEAEQHFAAVVRLRPDFSEAQRYLLLAREFLAKPPPEQKADGAK